MTPIEIAQEFIVIENLFDLDPEHAMDRYESNESRLTADNRNDVAIALKTLGSTFEVMSSNT